MARSAVCAPRFGSSLDFHMFALHTRTPGGREHALGENPCFHGWGCTGVRGPKGQLLTDRLSLVES